MQTNIRIKTKKKKKGILGTIKTQRRAGEINKNEPETMGVCTESGHYIAKVATINQRTFNVQLTAKKFN